MSKITTYHQNLFRIKLSYSLELTISQKKMSGQRQQVCAALIEKQVLHTVAFWVANAKKVDSWK